MASKKDNTAIKESPDDIAKDREYARLLARLWIQDITYQNQKKEGTLLLNQELGDAQ
ncbi:hypothetical protein SAMN04488500_106130 [Sporomusa malonica]|uniref:Uncharacterized protein n=1 Tax=Sporomusa malonica TaxID=112901 RepID=A0A1W2AV45_9FIRM|nr:hypothetical protein SAMN04488500_106130 [Sporomusa malonica]